MSVTPQAGLNYQIAVGGTSVQAVPANPNGGFITNPASATETLYINPIGAASLSANNTTFGLGPGQSWSIIPSQTTITWVNAATSGHTFSVVWW